MSGPVLYTERSKVAWITLNRPEHLNALDTSLPSEFVAAVDKAGRADAIRAIAITGSGAAFSSGADLQMVRECHEAGEAWPVGNVLRDHYNPMITVITASSKPTVAVINGPAAGAGASLALACDFRLASTDAYLYLAFVNLGFIPDCGLTYFLPRMVGFSRALEISLTSPKVEIAQAVRLGIVNRIASPDDLMEEAERFLEELVAFPLEGFARTKRALHRGMTHDLDETLCMEADLQEELQDTPDHREGVRAFFNKVIPRFG